LASGGLIMNFFGGPQGSRNFTGGPRHPCPPPPWNRPWSISCQALSSVHLERFGSVGVNQLLSTTTIGVTQWAKPWRGLSVDAPTTRLPPCKNGTGRNPVDLYGKENKI